MADPSNSLPMFVDVSGAQQQYPIAQVFTHYTLQIEPLVKKEDLEQEVVIQQVDQHVEELVVQRGQQLELETDQDVGIQVEEEVDVPPIQQPALEPIGCTDNQAVEPTGCSGNPEQSTFRCTEKITNNMTCTYSTTIEDRLIRHIRKVHRGENPFQCSMCVYSTYNKAVFEDHVRVHQGIKPFKCTFCEYRSASKKNTKKHELIHRPDNPNKCDECNFIARHHKSLKRHKDEEHRPSNGVSSLSDNASTGPAPAKLQRRSKLFQCSRCNTQYTDLRKLNEHLKKNRNCIECGIMLCHKAHEIKHMLSVHGRHSGPALFTCATCGWQTNIKSKALLHLVHHPQQVDESSLDVGLLRRHNILA